MTEASFSLLSEPASYFSRLTFYSDGTANLRSLNRMHLICLGCPSRVRMAREHLDLKLAFTQATLKGDTTMLCRLLATLTTDEERKQAVNFTFDVGKKLPSDVIIGKRLTPLHVAAARADPLMTRLLLMSGANPEAQEAEVSVPDRGGYTGPGFETHRGVTPLMLCYMLADNMNRNYTWYSVSGIQAVSAFFIDCTPCLDRTTDNTRCTALHFAMHFECASWEVVKVLLTAGAAYDLMDVNDHTPMIMAAMRSHVAAMHFLQNSHMDVEHEEIAVPLIGVAQMIHDEGSTNIFWDSLAKSVQEGDFAHEHEFYRVTVPRVREHLAALPMSELMVMALLKQEDIIGRDNSAMFDNEMAVLAQCVQTDDRVDHLWGLRVLHAMLERMSRVVNPDINLDLMPAIRKLLKDSKFVRANYQTFVDIFKAQHRVILSLHRRAQNALGCTFPHELGDDVIPDDGWMSKAEEKRTRLAAADRLTDYTYNWLFFLEALLKDKRSLTKELKKELSEWVLEMLNGVKIAFDWHKRGAEDGTDSRVWMTVAHLAACFSSDDDEPFPVPRLPAPFVTTLELMHELVGLPTLKDGLGRGPYEFIVDRIAGEEFGNERHRIAFKNIIRKGLTNQEMQEMGRRQQTRDRGLTNPHGCVPTEVGHPNPMNGGKVVAIEYAPPASYGDSAAETDPEDFEDMLGSQSRLSLSRDYRAWEDNGTIDKGFYAWVVGAVNAPYEKGSLNERYGATLARKASTDSTRDR